MRKETSERLTMTKVLKHPYLAGAESMRANWVADFKRFKQQQQIKKKKEEDGFFEATNEEDESDDPFAADTAAAATSST